MVDELALLLRTYSIYYHISDLNKQNQHHMAISRGKFSMFELKAKSFIPGGKPSEELEIENQCTGILKKTSKFYNTEEKCNIGIRCGIGHVGKG